MQIKSNQVNNQHSQVGGQNFARMNVKEKVCLIPISGIEVYIVSTAYQTTMLQYNLLRGQKVRQVRSLSQLTWLLAQ